jgi:DNA-binding response OmpR family regulator
MVRTLLNRFAKRSQPPPIPQVQPADVPAPEPVKPRGQKILIVDDDAVLLKATGLKLEAQGFGVITAAEGSAAIRAARNEKPDLILLDLSFPSEVSLTWDGFLIMTWLRRMEETRHIPVIVVTGGDPVQYQKRSLNAGAADFFQKPVAPDSLLASIEQTLSGGSPARKSSDFQI